MVLLLPIAFVAGLVTVLTPCILPVLPILLAGGGTGGRRRPYAIVAGLVTTFTLFVLAGAWIFSQLHLGKQWQTRIAVIALLVLAAALVVPAVAQMLERPLLFLTRVRTSDLGGGFVLGAALGLVFAPCAGPVFGAVSALAGQHRVGGWTVAIAIAYALGAAVPMLAVARGGTELGRRLRAHAPAVRVGAGVVIAAAALGISQGWETTLQKSVPSWAQAIQDAVEGNAFAKRHLAKLQDVPLRDERPGLSDYGRAPGFHGISHWLNTRPLTLSSLRGNVVLVDFWTYSCINCLRTLPHLEAWYRAYRRLGLEIVGVHTPEFQFEHVLANVRDNARKLGVRYPVALDNGYSTWKAYHNEYWPAEYLIDRRGHLRHFHFGEGEYSHTEQLIRELLGARGPTTRTADSTPTGSLTPETYLGYARLGNYGGSMAGAEGGHFSRYVLPTHLGQDRVAYGGVWLVDKERIVAGKDAVVRLHFRARDVYLVAGGRGTVRVFVDGRRTRIVRVDGSRLYTVVTGKRIRSALLELRFTRGLRAYSFTFG